MIPLRDTEPSYTRPIVVICLIVLNLIIFLREASMAPYEQNAFIATYGMIPDEFTWKSLFTSMFLHGGWMHVIGNMWFLWIFGDNVEDILGHGKFLLFYIACGMAAGLAQVFIDPSSRVPTVGASGAIAGVMGAYIVKFPRSRILTLIPIIIFFTTVEVPAWLMLFYWFFIQLFQGLGTIGYSHISQGGGVAYMAHVGGFVAGAVLILLLVPRPPRRYVPPPDYYWR
ncbi:MAG TPA: rhomboid family intramembrane serine protease [Candidatus Solibacter sp.]|jgi:membrane associated rhomboid family serine protease|nr:rhomboid family intramembrane serine protease [Candidatus Solibacter sp.]